MSPAVRSIVDQAGTGAAAVEVECHITNGLPAIIIIGGATKAVDEAKERLRASFANSDIQLPRKRITLNLSPADLPKDATSLDLAMAVAILAESRQIKRSKLSGCYFLGELSLEGNLNPVRGLIGRLLSIKKPAAGRICCYLPSANRQQAMLVPGIDLKIADSLKQVFMDLNQTSELKAVDTGAGRNPTPAPAPDSLDLSEITGQQLAKRALEIAAAGHHNLILHGPPGTGKTMLAKALCGILPDLGHSEVLEVTHLHSLAGSAERIITQRPFRSPHHTASTTALVGGGTRPKPGEASLAHRGVLFLDELPEFNHSALEALRQPLEDGLVNIARVRDTATYPARFILVASMNPCPCGYFGTARPCVCPAGAIEKYRKKISGPILDRVDLHLAVNEVDHQRILAGGPRRAESAPAKRRVEAAYAGQRRRFGQARYNGSMTNQEVRQLANLSAGAKRFIDQAAPKLELSARAYVRSVKVARTIADLSGSSEIAQEHVAEALSYRQPLLN